MRPTTLFVIFAVAALGALACLGKQTDINLPTAPNIQLPSVALPALMPSTKDEQGHSQVTVYKWQDGSGQWRYSSTPPNDGFAFEAVQIETDRNIVPAFVPEPKTQTEGNPSMGPVADLKKLIKLPSSTHATDAGKDQY